ncbi:hypothetical protein ACH5RR_001938 [Cinchona calisaya]|uniref:Uncharacterized protein n=1 Tax=Cinchona calisaya TaxID=153742 RepID=A0ABD3B642_9GENT
MYPESYLFELRPINVSGNKLVSHGPNHITTNTRDYTSSFGMAETFAALEKGKESEKSDLSSVEDSCKMLEPEETIASQMTELNLSANSSAVNPLQIQQSLTPVDHYIQDIDKKIRALKKKIFRVLMECANMCPAISQLPCPTFQFVHLSAAGSKLIHIWISVS